jgi:hypothetical protein
VQRRWRVKTCGHLSCRFYAPLHFRIREMELIKMNLKILGAAALFALAAAGCQQIP